MTIRVFIQTALIGLSIPLFSTLVIELTSGGDPTFWGAFGVLLASVLFFVLSWLIPNRAVGLLARGLAISGTDVLAGLSSAARGIRGFAGAGGGRGQWRLTTFTTGARMRHMTRTRTPSTVCSPKIPNKSARAPGGSGWRSGPWPRRVLCATVAVIGWVSAARRARPGQARARHPVTAWRKIGGRSRWRSIRPQTGSGSACSGSGS